MVYNLNMGDLAQIFCIPGESFDHRRAYLPADGRRLALTSGGYVRLLVPDTHHNTIPLVFDDLDCAAAVRVNEG